MPTNRLDLTNFDTIQRAWKALQSTKETDLLNTLTPCELLTAVTTLRHSGFDLYLDQLTPREVRLAAKGDAKALDKSLAKRF